MELDPQQRLWQEMKILLERTEADAKLRGDNLPAKERRKIARMRAEFERLKARSST